MGKFRISVLWGILLIVGGLFFLLQSLGIVAVASLVWPFLFGAASLVFLVVFLTDPGANWWAAIPGFVLLGLTALMTLDQLAPQIGETWGGSIFLGGIALAFGAVYLSNREHWWALIPGGVLLTIALVAGLSSLPGLGDIEIGGIFFLGLGVTFGLLSLLPTPEERLTWALIPAAVLLVMGLLIFVAATEILNYIWPVVLILAGLYLLYRIFVAKGGRA